jgi:hypothetical protein
MESILIDHAHRYPNWAVADLYKLIHQAALGSEHAIRDEAHAREWLARELTQLGPGPDEPLIDPISPGGQVVRVHLRPFASLRLDEETLLKAFVLTANEFKGSPDRLLEYADVAEKLGGEGLLPIEFGEVSRCVAGMHAAGFPAVHHSPKYEEAYRPAYRVVVRELLTAEILTAASRQLPGAGRADEEAH